MTEQYLLLFFYKKNIIGKKASLRFAAHENKKKTNRNKMKTMLELQIRGWQKNTYSSKRNDTNRKCKQMTEMIVNMYIFFVQSCCSLLLVLLFLSTKLSTLKICTVDVAFQTHSHPSAHTANDENLKAHKMRENTQNNNAIA